jgi:hypothetical protein
MPFCQSCGAEIQPGKNFCSNCGTPLGAPGASPLPPEQDMNAPVSPVLPAPPAPSPAPGPSRDKIIIAAVMGAAILGLIIFIGLPLIQGQGAGSISLQDPSPSSAGTPVPVPFTPHAYATTLSSGAMTASSAGTTVYRSGIAYDQVFARDYQKSDSGVQDVFSYSLQTAPMIVECDMNPEIVSREQLVDIDTANERYITSTYPDPNAWLDLKVINADTGNAVTTISFSKNYRGELKQTYTVRANGNYRFEIAGVRVTPSVRLLVKQ